MNYLVQRGKVRGQVINVPEGLPELLSDITREVLRCQPTTECLCQFIIDYLHSVIVTREKAQVAKSIIDRALRIVDEIISDLCICDITKEKASEMALAMEQCFKRFLEQYRCEQRKEKEIVKFGELDMLDELINRCKFSEDELKITRPMIEDAYNRFVDAYMSAAEGTEGTEALYLYFKEREKKRIEEEILAQAATRIQASFRGFLVRRELFIPKRGIDGAELEGEEEHEEFPCQKFYRHSKDNVANVMGEGLAEDESFREVCSPKSNRSQETAPVVSEAGLLSEGAPSAYSAGHDFTAEFEANLNQKLEEEMEAAEPEQEIPQEEIQEPTAVIEEPEEVPIVEVPEEPEAAPEAEVEAAPEPEPEPPEPEPEVHVAAEVAEEHAPEVAGEPEATVPPEPEPEAVEEPAAEPPAE